MRPTLTVFLTALGLAAGGTAVAVKYRPDQAPTIAAGSFMLVLGVLLIAFSEVKAGLRSMLRR